MTSLRILIIEDDPAIVMATQFALRIDGHEDVVEALTENAARQLLDERTFDLVIADLHLGDGDGMSVLRELRDRGDQTPAVLASASVDECVTEQCTKLGVAHVIKPYSREELRGAMARVLAAHG